MEKLIFRENKDKYGIPVIEWGYWLKRDDGSELFSSILDIDLKNREVNTDCGDSYMDYSIGFDDFLAIADKIRELEAKYGERG